METINFSDVRNARKLRISEQPENINKTQVSFLDWSKLDIRVGKILKVEDIEGADKLYKLEVDIGDEKRTICAGIKKFYSKEELKGRKCVVFCNLEPKKLRGIESKGMILAAVNEDESKVILIIPKLEAKEGAKIEFKNG